MELRSPLHMPQCLSSIITESRIILSFNSVTREVDHKCYCAHHCMCQRRGRSHKPYGNVLSTGTNNKLSEVDIIDNGLLIGITCMKCLYHRKWTNGKIIASAKTESLRYKSIATKELIHTIKNSGRMKQLIIIAQSHCLNLENKLVHHCTAPQLQ